MKNIIKSAVSAAALCLALSMTAAYADDGVTVSLNGKTLSTPIPAQIVNDRTMLPMRAVFEALGANVDWVEADKLIFATKGNKFIALKIGVPQISVQTTESTENKVIELDTAPFVKNDYTLVPVRAVAESLNAKVDWDGETKTVVITTD